MCQQRERKDDVIWSLGATSNAVLFQSLRANVNMRQSNSDKSPKICFHSYFHIS